MATTDITKPTDKSISRPRDMFASMRDEMERVFGQFERGFPNWPRLFRRGNGEGGLAPVWWRGENFHSRYLI
jgi:hypothetical protein